MTTGELVTNLRYLGGSDADLTESIAVVVDSNHHLVDDTVLTPPHEHAGVSLTVPITHTAMAINDMSLLYDRRCIAADGETS